MKTRTLTSLAAFAASFLLTLPALSQDFQSGYFLGGYNAAFRMNPAIQNERNVLSIGLGNIGVGVNSNLGPDTFLYKIGGERVNAFNDKVSTDTFLEKISMGGNYLGANAGLDVLTVGFWSKRNYFTIDVRARMDAEVSAPYDLFAFMKAPDSMQSLDLSGTAFGVNGILEAALGISHNFNNKFNVGGRVKFLYGVLSAQIMVDQMTASRSNDSWTFNGQGSLQASSPAFNVKTNEEGNIDIEDFTAEFDVQELKHPAGFGAAVDLGATWNVLPFLTVSGTVLDLGAMRWNRAVYGEMRANYTWQKDPDSTESSSRDMDDAMDALYDILNFKQESGSAAFSFLPITANLGAEVRIPAYQRLSLGVLGTLKHSQICTWKEGRVSANWTPANALSFSVSTTVNNLGQFVGFAFNLHPGALNFFVGTDYIPLASHPIGYFLEEDSDLPAFVREHVLLPSDRLNINLYFGLNIAFGKRHLDYARRYIL